MDEESKKERKKKIRKIQERLKEYHTHKSDPHAYFEIRNKTPEEIKALLGIIDKFEIRNKAPEDIKALLDIIDKLETEIKRLEGLLKNQIVD